MLKYIVLQMETSRMLLPVRSNVETASVGELARTLHASACACSYSYRIEKVADCIPSWISWELQSLT